jgi:RimJ/RimL family protein N-acetyltransferase
MTILLTSRLRLEPSAEKHLDGLNEMNQRPEVMRFFGGQPETREQTAAGIARVQRSWSVLGTSWWAFVDLASNRVAGAGCIQYLRRESAIPEDLESLRGNPLEIGWRLHPDFWRQGYATEAARRMAAFAFQSLKAKELLAVRHPENEASARVMDRLGMSYRGLEPWYGTSVATHVLSHETWLYAQRASPVVPR